LGLGTLLRLSIGILNSRLITFYLNENNLTYFYLILSIYSLFALGFINPLNLFFTKYLYTFHKKNHLFEAFYFLFKKFLIIPLLIYILSLTYYFTLNEFEFILIAILIIYIISKSLNDTLISVFNLVGRNKRFVFLINLNLLFSIILSFLLIQVFGSSYLNWFLGIVLSQIIMTVLGIYFYFKTFKKNSLVEETEIFDSKNYKLSNKNYYYFILINIAGWFFVEGYKLFFEFYLDREILINFLIGFVVAFQVVSILETFNQQLNSPIFLQIVNKKNDEEISLEFLMLLKKSIYFFLPAFLALFFFKNIIIEILIDNSKLNEQVYFYFKIGLIYAIINAFLNLFKLLFMSKFELNKILISFLTGIFIFFVMSVLSPNVDISIILLTSIMASTFFLLSNFLLNINLKK